MKKKIDEREKKSKKKRENKDNLSGFLKKLDQIYKNKKKGIA